MMELDNCPCSGANLPRFVQPVILAVLSSGPLHGYLVVRYLWELVHISVMHLILWLNPLQTRMVSECLVSSDICFGL